jgi:hypothetical protein
MDEHAANAAVSEQPTAADADAALDEGDMDVEGFADDAFAADAADDSLADEGDDQLADFEDQSEELAGDEDLDAAEWSGAGFEAEDNFEAGFDGSIEGSVGPTSGDALDLLESTVADALDAEDSDEFFRALLGGIGRIAGTVRRGCRRGRSGRRGRRATGWRRLARGGEEPGRRRGFARRAQRLASQVGGAARTVSRWRDARPAPGLRC